MPPRGPCGGCRVPLISFLLSAAGRAPYADPHRCQPSPASARQPRHPRRAEAHLTARPPSICVIAPPRCFYGIVQPCRGPMLPHAHRAARAGEEGAAATNMYNKTLHSTFSYATFIIVLCYLQHVKSSSATCYGKNVEVFHPNG